MDGFELAATGETQEFMFGNSTVNGTIAPSDKLTDVCSFLIEHLNVTHAIGVQVGTIAVKYYEVEPEIDTAPGRSEGPNGTLLSTRTSPPQATVFKKDCKVAIQTPLTVKLGIPCSPHPHSPPLFRKEEKTCSAKCVTIPSIVRNNQSQVCGACFHTCPPCLF